MTRREGRLYRPLLWNIGCTLLVAGTTLSILMWANVIGPFRFLRLSTGQHQQQALVGFWVPDASDHIVPGELARRIDAWRRLLSHGLPLLARDSLDELVADGAGVVIVPDARFLDAERIAELQRFVRQGRGAILTGPVGVRESDGRWRGWDLMASLLSVSQVIPLERNAAQQISAWRRGPLSAGLSPGESVRLSPESGAPAIADTDAGAELRWPASATADAGGIAAASKRFELGRGRLLWLAAGPERSWDPGVGPWQAMARLVGAALAWVGRQPWLELLPWPDGARFAGRLEAVSDWQQSGAETARSGFESEIHRAEISGGLARLALPATGPGGRELRALAISLLRQSGAWIASQEQIVAWVSGRASIATRFERVGPGRVLLKLSNLGPAAVDRSVLRVHLNRPVEAATVAPTLVFQRRPGIRYRRGLEWLDLLLPEIPAGVSYSYALDYEILAPEGSEERLSGAWEWPIESAVQ